MITFLAMLPSQISETIWYETIMTLTDALYDERVGEDGSPIMYHNDKQMHTNVQNLFPSHQHPSQYHLAQQASFC